MLTETFIVNKSDARGYVIKFGVNKWLADVIG